MGDETVVVPPADPEAPAMIPLCQWRIDSAMILSRRELAIVLADLRRRAPRALNTRLNLVIVRLACCCGLRVSEIRKLRLADVRTGIDRPHLSLGAQVAKGGRPRRVPLWWDEGTLADLDAWLAERREHGADPDDLVVGSMQVRRRGLALSRQTLRTRFRTACRALGGERVRELTIHHGRHTFVSHALAGGRTLAEARDAAGHSSVWVTSAYLHVAVDDDGTVGHLFRYD